MGIIPGFKHDLFVSYAHIDNERPLVLGNGWVDVLVSEMQAGLRQRLGTTGFDIWKDEMLEGNRPLTPDLLHAVRSSALLLVVLSPSYLHSDWCRRERHEFLAAVKERVASGSVFLVRTLPIDEPIPPEFGDLTGYEFFTRDPDMKSERVLGTVAPREDKFVRKVFDLCNAIKEQVVHLKSKRVDPAPESRRRVFLARSTDDLEDGEDALRAYLSQVGIDVLPTRSYPDADAAAFEAAMRADLERCHVFAQLLSKARGRKLPFEANARLPRLQYEIAQRTEIPVLQWRERGLDVESVEDAAHRALLEQARACGLEDFKRAVVGEARKERIQAVPPPPPNVTVFVNANALDRKFAKEVGNELGRLGIECWWPLETGTPEEIRRYLEQNLRECNGLLLVYGNTGAEWVWHQYREGRKILSQRTEPPAALALVEGPPPDKAELPGVIPGIMMLDGRNGIDSGTLRQFVNKIRPEASHGL